MGHSGPPVDSQPWGRAPKTREHTSRAGGIPTGRGGRAPPFLKRGPEGPVRHQSRRGDLPGREEVWVGFQQLRSAAFHLPHSTTGLPWPTDRRANVRWSKSDWGGSRLSIYRNSPISPGQLVNSTPHHPYKVGYLHAACPNPRPSTAILALPWPPRCLAIRARPTPHPGPSLPAAPRITPSHLANWSIPFASTHARNSPRAPDACLPGPPPCSGAAWPAILRANVLWSESDSWGTPTGPPRPGDRLARPTGQWPFVAHEGPDGLLALIPLESSQRDAESIPSSVGFLRRSRMANWRMKLVEREGGRDPWLTAGSPIPEAPSNRPALPDLSVGEVYNTNLAKDGLTLSDS
ncbi:hypothetical protein AAWM_08776 [Aspergillus awamori]|uniref:Uncharacterized protein n=1 Tax=Aspergillus awamori TaxID=105351 RepID=A0A401L2Z1_ASPAW|nr:hypothetical protein AAWM_08773 [Aspergillus awamori]GCB25889.1 hypothetical protein AAWM_08774 [Aspergillus awamori]GCB25890.1 hypothetical protein AAWM_08775 [Aspergillus awamori]GCB25891.1 hypothetical protein AAWM_08776 [Aspergillus awamori]